MLQKKKDEFGLVTRVLGFPFYVCLIRRFPGNDDWIGLVSISPCSTVFRLMTQEGPQKVAGNEFVPPRKLASLFWTPCEKG